MLVTHAHPLPSFGILPKDETVVCVYTILSINEKVRDCAAYQAIGPHMGQFSDEDRQAMTERMKAAGSKISEREARNMFDEIEDMELRYRR